ncbi:hypothetical protein P3X46_026735 [Hevea brasiliensis]|uniref:Pentacotripeptide-repeat region of PRORP domain-containing protein n=1 Tax=Hevea brasiliensis TaxID=3981 RepID=A0ABQ9L134_HEVBR|nr:pentatricopeptide repeat-containing protein At4g38150 [Hevea brasiliensis]KAJ9153279.1 hypothetical protein P3X46_026735 [Hevea brasiliensis]
MASSHSRSLKLIRVKPHSQFARFVSKNLRHFSYKREPTTGFGSNFNSNDEDNDAREVQNPPHPIPNRPLRGDRGERPSYNSRSESYPTPRGPRNVKLSGSPRNTNQHQHQHHPSDDAFLEKFKLRLDRNKDSEIPLPNNPAAASATANIKEEKSIDSPRLNASAATNTKEGKSIDSPPPDAEDIFKKMKETGLIPNAVAMLDGLCKDGLVQEAMKLFGLMREKGTMPDVVVYTAVVDGFCKAHKLDDAKRIFRKMLDNGIAPNAFSYTVLIQGLYKCKLLDDAVDFSFQMLDAGHSPSVTTFVGLVDGLCREKGVEEAQRVIAALRQKGFFLNDKAIREFLDKNAPLSSSLWEAIFGKKPSSKPF